MPYQGIIIEESLENKDVLKQVEILSNEIEPVTSEHKTPWIKQWTMHTVEIPEQDADLIAEKISKSLDRSHGHWYAAFKDQTKHFIIFDDKVFKIDRTLAIDEQNKLYEAAKSHGLGLNIPDYQLDFNPNIKQWER